MQISIKGNGITPERIAEAIRICERDHKNGRMLASVTVTLHFIDDLGRAVEPLREDGCEIIRNFYFQEKRTHPTAKQPAVPAPEPVDPISATDMIELAQKQAHRLLSNKEMKILIELEKTIRPERQAFVQVLSASIQKSGWFDVHQLEKILVQDYKKRQHS